MANTTEPTPTNVDAKEQWFQEHLKRQACKPSRRMMNAYHEAGHAVIAMSERFDVGEVSIEWKYGGMEAELDSEGRTRFVAPKELDFFEKRRILARIAMAGRIAEQMAKHQRPVLRLYQYSGTDKEGIDRLEFGMPRLGFRIFTPALSPILQRVEGFFECARPVRGR